jgi:hypothetical protein
VDGRDCRIFSNVGNLFHKAPFTFTLPEGVDIKDVAASISGKDQAFGEICLRFGSESSEASNCAPINVHADDKWKSLVFKLTGADKPAFQALRPGLGAAASSKRFGNGRILIRSVRMIKPDGSASWIHKVGDPVVIEMEYEVISEPLPADIHAAINISNAKNGSSATTITTLAQGKMILDKPKGVIRFVARDFALYKGEYVLTVAFFKELSWEIGETPYTVSKDIYDHRAYAFNFKMTGGIATEYGVYCQRGKWMLSDTPDSAPINGQ